MADGGTLTMLSASNTSMDPNPQATLSVDSGKDSVRSTKSLSVFVNPDTPNTMARSEELTMNMYTESPDQPSSRADRHSHTKRRHRETTDHSATKEDRKTDSSSASKPGFFGFMKKKKKKTTETKLDISSPAPAAAAVEISTTTHADKNKRLEADAENSLNHRTEVESTETNATAGVAQSASSHSEQVTTVETIRTVKTAESKSSNSPASAENATDVGLGQPSAAVSDSNNNSAAAVTMKSSATAGVGSENAGTAQLSTAGKTERGKRTTRQQQEDDNTERTVHSLPSYSPADVDLSSSAVRDKNVRAKFEAMLGSQDSGGSGFSTPSAAQTKHRGRHDSAAASETGSTAGSTLTRRREQKEELNSPAAIDRMAEVQSVVPSGQVSSVVGQLSSASPSVTEQPRPRSTENREYTTDSNVGNLSLQEDVVMEATSYRGLDEVLTPPGTTTSAPPRQQQSTSDYDAKDHKSSSAVHENRDAVTSVRTAGLSNGSDSHLRAGDSAKTVQKSTTEVKKSQQQTNSRTEQPSSRTTTHAIQQQKDSASKVSTAHKTQLDMEVEKAQHSQKVRSQPKDAQPKDTPKYTTVVRKDGATKTQTTAGQNAIHISTSDRPAIGRSQRGEEQQRTQPTTRTEREEDRDSTPTPTGTRKVREQDRVDVQTRSTKTHVGRRRSQSPGAHGIEMHGSQERVLQRTAPAADQTSDDTDSVSDVRERQHALKARTQEELLQQAKHRSRTANVASGDHDVRTAAKSTFTVTMSNQGSQRDNVEIQPSKASLQQNESANDHVDGRQHRSAAFTGRSGSKLDRKQPSTEGYRNESTNLEWGDPGQDSSELRSHVRARDHRVPARTQSNASSDISSSIGSSLDYGYQPAVESRPRHANHLGGWESSSDATATETYDSPGYRGQKTKPGGREPIRRNTSLPVSDEGDVCGDPAVMNFSSGRQGYIVESRQPDAAVMYKGRSTAPSSGRQKIKRTTETPENDDDASEPRSGRMYTHRIGSSGDMAEMCSGDEVYERGPRPRQVPSGRARLDHNRALSSSPDDDVKVTGYRPTYAAPSDDRDYAGDNDLDVPVRNRPQRQAPSGRTGKIPRSGGEVDIRVVNNSPDRFRTSMYSASDDGDFVDEDDPEAPVRNVQQRQAPSGRTGKIPRSGGEVDIRVVNSSPERVRTPASTDNRPSHAARDDRHYVDGDDLDVPYHQRPQRQAPTGRTGKIPRGGGGDVDIRIVNGSPDRVRTPTLTDDRQHRQMGDHTKRTPTDHTRRVPTDRTATIQHGSSVDINVVDESPNGMRPVHSRQTSDGHRTPMSTTTDWLRPQRSGQLTVDVTGQPTDSLHRAYRSMPDLLDDDEILPNRSSRNYSSYYEDDEVDQARHRQPVSSNPAGARNGGRVTAIIRDPLVDPSVRHRVRRFSTSETEMKRPSVGTTSRKRGYITGATVENRGRRSGRTSDMPWTDVEDLYDGSGVRPRSSENVVRVYVGGDYDDDVGWETGDDLLSVFSEPVRRSTNTLSSSRSATPHRPSAILTAKMPTPPPPTIRLPQGAFELSHVDTQIHHQPHSPEVTSPEATISAVDPALRDASKHGTNYHITLTLKPTISTPTSPRPGTVTSRSQLITSSQHVMTSQDHPPRSVSSMAVYNDNPTAPGTNSSQPPPDRGRPSTVGVRPGRPAGTSTTVPADRPQRPRSRSHSGNRRPPEPAGEIGFDVEVRSISDDDQVVDSRSTTISSQRHQQNITDYELPISGSVEFMYSPPYDNDQDNDEFRRRQPIRAAPVRAPVDDEPRPAVPRRHHQQQTSHVQRSTAKAPQTTEVVSDDTSDTSVEQRATYRPVKENPRVYTNGQDVGRGSVTPTESPPGRSDSYASDDVDAPVRRLRQQNQPRYVEDKVSDSENARRAPRNFAPPPSIPSDQEIVSDMEESRRTGRNYASPPIPSDQEMASDMEESRRTGRNYAPPPIPSDREAVADLEEGRRAGRNCAPRSSLGDQYNLDERRRSSEDRSGRRPPVDHIDGDVRAGRGGGGYSVVDGGNIDLGRAGYSAAAGQKQQQRRGADVTQVRQVRQDDDLLQPAARRTDWSRDGVQHTSQQDNVQVKVDQSFDNDELISRGYAGKQRSSLLQDTRAAPTQDGFGSGYYDNRYGVANQELDVRRDYRPTQAARHVNGGAQRMVPTDEELRYRTTHDERRVDTSQSGRLSQSAMMVRDMYEDGEFDQEVSITRGFGVNEHDGEGMAMMRSRLSDFDSRRAVGARQMIAMLDVQTLLINAPTTSVRQTIDVERLEDEIVSGRGRAIERGGSSAAGAAVAVSVGSSDKIAASISDYDTVSEKVEMEVTDGGMAISTARVRCERTVPIRGSADMFQRSSVIVTKSIHVDLTVNSHRRRLWKAIHGVKTTLDDVHNHTADADDDAQQGPLSKSDTLMLYHKFKQLVELNKVANRSAN